MAGAMPQNHAQTLRDRQPLSRRARWLWALSAVVAVAVVVALALSGDGGHKRGCIHTFLPGAMGAVTFDACGSIARHTCATLDASPQYSSVDVLYLKRVCRQSHIPVG